jgi:hypothetical protein
MIARRDGIERKERNRDGEKEKKDGRKMGKGIVKRDIKGGRDGQRAIKKTERGERYKELSMKERKN